MRLVLILLLLLIPFQASTSQDNAVFSKHDSIIFFRNQSKDISLPLEERLILAQKASKLASEIDIDTTTVLNNRNLSFLYLMLDDYEPFKDINYKNLELATKLKDTFVVAIAYSNLAWYYHHFQKNDSAFYYYTKSLKNYEAIKNLESQASILSSIADIQSTEKDYIGSEESAIQALKLLQKLPQTERNLDRQWILYNLLGVISFQLKQYSKSLEYHEKALEISNKQKDGYYNKYTSINNRAYIFRKQGDFAKALELYQSILKEKRLFEIDPTFYPLILDNIAFTKFEANEKDYDGIEQMLKKALKISDSLEERVIKLGVFVDLSKFYKGIGKNDSALVYADQTYKLAKDISNNDILLESMLLLSELKPGEEGKKYLNEHIRLSDSLLFNERSARNKFARIAFETDEIERENERISRERLWLLGVSIVLVLTVVLLYIVITQRAKNKELQFKQSQQEANEEIYNLMLSQQDKVDEARTNEKKRISQELHDGILGRLFGTRLSLDSLNFSDSKEAIQKRLNYISDLKIIEEDIRKISHDLNTDFVSGSGFMDILTELIEKQSHAFQLKYEFNHEDDINWEDVSNKTKINIYRVIQESLQNTYKHAKANTIKIGIKPKKDVICLSISDDGKGFDIHKSKKGIGLKNIKSRVNELEGKVNFNSEINKGTTITINIPYQSN